LLEWSEDMAVRFVNLRKLWLRKVFVDAIWDELNEYVDRLTSKHGLEELHLDGVEVLSGDSGNLSISWDNLRTLQLRGRSSMEIQSLLTHILEANPRSLQYLSCESSSNYVFSNFDLLPSPIFLRSLPSLRTLELVVNRIFDEELTPISRLFPQLETLVLVQSNALVSPEICLRFVEQNSESLPNLQSLQLRSQKGLSSASPSWDSQARTRLMQVCNENGILLTFQ